MKFGFAPRIAITLAIVLVMGVTMTGILSIHKFERTLVNLLTSRFLFVANDIRQQIETQMDLGLPLVDLQGVREVLDEYLGLDQQILSIEIFDETGNVLFSTDTSFVGDLVSENWLLLWRANRSKEMWSTLEVDAGVVGVPLLNNLSQNVGSLALRYSRTFLDQSVNDQVERLFLAGVGIVIVISLLTFVVCTNMLKRACQDLQNLAMAMANIMHRDKDGIAIEEAEKRFPQFFLFTRQAFNAHDSLDSATAKIRQLDEDLN